MVGRCREWVVKGEERGKVDVVVRRRNVVDGMRFNVEDLGWW